MNCGYIHSAHGCSQHLAWSFCTEVLFTHYYRKMQRKQQSDNDPSGHPRNRRTLRECVMSAACCSCLDSGKRQTTTTMVSQEDDLRVVKIRVVSTMKVGKDQKRLLCLQKG